MASVSIPDPFRSERLIYRAVEEDDDPFILSIKQNGEDYMNSTPFLPVPQGKKEMKSVREWLGGCLLSAVICLPAPVPSTPGDAAAGKATSIGTISLMNVPPGQKHHRRTEIGIVLAKNYQGQGYGTEAIKWALHWAFMRAGMHKVQISTVEYNKGALRLYQGLGFTVDGRSRHHVFHDGQFWDFVNMSMLEDEWKEKYVGGEKH